MENQPQENSQVREANAAAPSVSQGGDDAETTEQSPWMKFRQMLRESFENARKSQQPGSTRRERSKDKSKSLFLVVGAAIAMLLILLSVLSSPQKAKKLDTGRRPRTSDLGRRVTPGQENAQPGSVTPMLNAQMNGDQGMNNGDVTPEDVGRTARLGMGQSHAARPAAALSQGIPEKKSQQQYALNRIQFDSALAQQPGYGVAPAYQQAPVPLAGTKTNESDELRKPSLVFVRAAESSPVRVPAAPPTVAQEQAAVLDILPPGTRLVARLESAVSTAVKEPVIAVIEYNYERDGEIIVPAGAKAVGQLRQANRSGYVDIKFDTMEMPDGTTEKMEGVAMDLKFGPLKGDVGGKRTVTKFLVRSLTGAGTVAAYLVGGGGTGFNGPLSESALLRERIANNVGMAGDQELNDLAFNQNIVVTVPGNTRFYIVLQNVAPGSSEVMQPSALTSTRPGGTNVPTLDELRQLMQLKQELSAMYQQASTTSTAAQAPQQ